MYLSIPSAVYRDCLTTARTAMVTRGSLPVLNFLHFRITPEAPYVLEVTSTDLDVSLTQLIPLTEPGGPVPSASPSPHSPPSSQIAAHPSASTTRRS